MNHERDPISSLRSTIDDVTGLYNRRMLYDRVRAEIARCRRFQFACSCVILEISGLEGLQDRLGLAAADHVLKEIAGILRASTRLYDGLFRHAADQLAIVLPQAEAGEARTVAERIRRRIEAHSFTSGDEPLHVKVRLGLATFPQQVKDPELLLLEAENALAAFASD